MDSVQAHNQYYNLPLSIFDINLHFNCEVS